MKRITSIIILSIIILLPYGQAQADSAINISGSFTGSFTNTYTALVCDPNNTPVTFSGWVEVTGVEPGGAAMFGLVDQGLINSGDSGWGSGAYAYFGRISTNVRIGPSDGFLGGEVNSVGANIPYVAGGPNKFNFTATIFDGSITVSYGGNDYTILYGGIEDANTLDAYPGSEFDGGAYVAINTFPDTNVVDFDISISGCTDAAGPETTTLVATPNPAAVNSLVEVSATVDDTNTGGSFIASAEYSLDGGNWTGMAPADGDFDAVSENVNVSFAAPDTPGIYDLCVLGTDAPGNTGPEECIMLVVYDPDGGFVTGGGWIDSPSGQVEPIYTAIPDPFPGSFPSLGYEATSTDETGDHIAFAQAGNNLYSVEVSLTDWACENDFDYVNGTWVPNRDGGAGEACETAPGSGFYHPITLNIYEVDNSGSEPAVGPLITTKTETFFIPFRPSWDAQNCTANEQTPETNKPFGGKWYDPVLGQCVNGYALTLEYDFSSNGIVLPDEVIYGVAYNTAHHGDSPLGVNGPYNSLNLSLTTDAPSVGTNVEGDTVFWDTSHGPFYCDVGAGGTDTFRRDAGCWGTYTPVVKFNTLIEGAYKADPTLGGKANFGFVSKYKKGANVPEGNTEFVFKAGDLNFHSTSYEWLIVTGSDYAKFKGSGTINGAGDYKFMLWAGDKDPDTFRIRIWYEDGGNEVVVYDNGMDQAIGGGNIVVHKK